MRVSAALLLLALPVAAVAQPAPPPPPHAEHAHKPTKTSAKPGTPAAKPPAKPATPAVTSPKPSAHKPVASKRTRNAKPAPPARPSKPIPPPAHAPEPAPAPVAPPTEGPPPEPPKGTNTGLPLPRFAALRSDDVNFRSGPGTRYPIEWVYKRRDLPVEIEREFEVWRLVRDPEGTKGWVHQATLTGRRTAIVAGAGAEHVLRQSANDTAPPVAKLEAGVILRVRSCEAGSEWCQAQVGDYHGWIRRRDIWGVLPEEVVQ